MLMPSNLALAHLNTGDPRITRRSALVALGIASASALNPAWGFAGEFWDQKQPSAWSKEEMERLMTKSPWAKEASIDNTAQSGPIMTRSVPTRRGGVANQTGTNPTADFTGKWKASVRWESALPVREALGDTKMTVALSENYIINVFGDIPSPAPSDLDSEDERKTKFDILQERTRIERKGDPLELKRVELSHRTPFSTPGTLFYFSRVFPIMPDDKQVTFVTKIGPLELKCKFTLKDMIYRGNLEL
jgi:hypothetical protein